jgi:hypothetical protein
MIPKISSIPIRRIAVAGTVSAVVICAVAGALRLVAPSAAHDQQGFQVAQIPNVSGNCNNFGNNNVNCNTFNFGAQARHLSAENKDYILKTIPKTRKVTITSQSSVHDAADLANEIYQFLASSGYSAEVTLGYSILAVQGRGVTILLNNDHPEQPVSIFVLTP